MPRLYNRGPVSLSTKLSKEVEKVAGLADDQSSEAKASGTKIVR